MCWTRSYLSRKANFIMLWAPKICNTSTWGTPDDQVLIDAPELVDCRWSLCLLTVVFGQHQHQQSEKDILRRHGDYFLRRVMSPLSIKSAVQKFSRNIFWSGLAMKVVSWWWTRGTLWSSLSSTGASANRRLILLLKLLQENCSP